MSGIRTPESILSIEDWFRSRVDVQTTFTDVKFEGLIEDSGGGEEEDDGVSNPGSNQVRSREGYADTLQGSPELLLSGGGEEDDLEFQVDVGGMDWIEFCV